MNRSFLIYIELAWVNDTKCLTIKIWSHLHKNNGDISLVNLFHNLPIALKFNFEKNRKIHCNILMCSLDQHSKQIIIIIWVSPSTNATFYLVVYSVYAPMLIFNVVWILLSIGPVSERCRLTHQKVLMCVFHFFLWTNTSF